MAFQVLSTLVGKDASKLSSQTLEAAGIIGSVVFGNRGQEGPRRIFATSWILAGAHPQKKAPFSQELRGNAAKIEVTRLHMQVSFHPHRQGIFPSSLTFMHVLLVLLAKTFSPFCNYTRYSFHIILFSPFLPSFAITTILLFFFILFSLLSFVSATGGGV